MIVWFGGQIQFWGWREWGYTGTRLLTHAVMGQFQIPQKGNYLNLPGHNRYCLYFD